MEITDAIQYLIDHNYHVTARHLTGYWTDTGKMDDMLEANRWVLETIESSVRGSVDETSALNGNVIV
ncbi:MAG: hypothetical protein JW395_3079 [Nitrospira sp.]|nr:hypothetical protein [Nitrospira sp.]